MNTQILYVADAYCGWCYGFSARINTFQQNNNDRDITFSLLSGGLFVGERVRPMSAFGHIQESNQKISALTGVTFGDKYNQLVQEGAFVMNSADAAAGLFTLTEQRPEKTYQLLHEVQQAFYQEGKSLSDVATFMDIAIRHELDPALVRAAWENGTAHDAASQQFALAQRIGVTQFPTLLFIHNNQAMPFTALGSSDEALQSELDQFLSQL